MKIVLSVFLVNLFILHQILAVPLDDTTQKAFIATDAGLSNESSASIGTSSDVDLTTVDIVATTIGTNENENGTSDQATTNALGVSDQVIANENNTSTDAGEIIESATAEEKLTTVDNLDLTTDGSFNGTVDSSTDGSLDNDTLTVTTIATFTTEDLGNATDIDATEGEDVTTAAPKPTTTKGPTKLHIVLDSPTLKVQRGQSYELVCNVQKADNTTVIYWIQEEPERRYAVVDSKGVSLSGSQATLRVRVTLDDPSKIGKYTCMAQDGKGNSDTAVLTMEEESRYYQPQPAYPDYAQPINQEFRYLRIAAPDMADGDYVEIQCEGAAPDDEGRVQWYFNERLLADENPLFPRGKTLHIRPISREYLGNYRCSIPGGNYGDGNSILTFSKQPQYDPQPPYNPQPHYEPQPQPPYEPQPQPPYDPQPHYEVPPVFNPSSPLSIEEGSSRIIQSPTDYERAYWTRGDGQGLPSDVYQIGNDLQISKARPDHSGTYTCELYKQDGTRKQVSYEIQVQHSQQQTGGLPKIMIQPQSIDLKEGQRMIVRYTIVSNEPIQIMWHKYTDQGYQPLPAGFTAEERRLVLNRATPDSAGIYQVTVRNSHGEVRQELRVNVEPRRHQHAGDHHHQHHDQQQHHHHHQQHDPQQHHHQQHDPEQHHQQQHDPQEQQRIEVTAQPAEVSIVPGERATVTCHVKGAQQYQVKWIRYAHDTSLPNFAYQQGNDLIINPPADTPPEQMYLQCQAEVQGQPKPYDAYVPFTIRSAKRKRRNLRK